MNRCPVHIGEGGAFYGCPGFRIFGDQGKRTPYISSSLGKISLHWGSCVRLPIRTKLRIGLLRADRMAAWPIDCKTMWIIPEAMSSGVAVRLSEVGGGGVQRQVGRGLLQMSCIWRVDIRQGSLSGPFQRSDGCPAFSGAGGESEQGSASDADAADMLDMRSFNLTKEVPVPISIRQSGFPAKRHICSEAVGQEFIGLGCRQAV